MTPSAVPAWVHTAAQGAADLSAGFASAIEMIGSAANEVKTETDSWTNEDWTGQGAEGAIGLSEALFGLAENLVAELEQGIGVADNYHELLCENSSNIRQWTAEWHEWSGKEPVPGELNPEAMLAYQESMIGEHVELAIDNDTTLSARMDAVFDSIQNSCAELEARINGSMTVGDLVQTSITIRELDDIVDAANDANWDNPGWEGVSVEDVEATMSELVEGGVVSPDDAEHPSMQLLVAWRLGSGADTTMIRNGIDAGNISVNEDGTLTYISDESSWDPVEVALIEEAVDGAVGELDWGEGDIPDPSTEVGRREFLLEEYADIEWGTDDGVILGTQVKRLLEDELSGEISDVDLMVLGIVLHQLATGDLELEPDHEGWPAFWEKAFEWTLGDGEGFGEDGPSHGRPPPTPRGAPRGITAAKIIAYVLEGGNWLFDRYVKPNDPEIPETPRSTDEPWQELENPTVDPTPPVEPEEPVTENAHPPNPEHTTQEPEEIPDMVPEPPPPPPEEQGPPTAQPPLPTPENPEEYYEENPVESEDCSHDSDDDSCSESGCSCTGPG